MFPSTGNLLLMMSFAAGTFSAGISGNPQHLMLGSPSNGVPNSPLPLIIYPRIVPDEIEDIAAYFEQQFAQHGWSPRWRAPVFPYTHYHSNTHELLGVCEGWAEILFGGESGRMVTLRAGDAVLIPAGVGHRQVAASEEFFTVGAYPEGMEPDTLRDDQSKMALAIKNIQRVPMPPTDPITGGEGAVTELWHPIAAQG
ncbi:cupin domain-containing protein [Erwiniaceae bacterium BAC15a-03b]|uniref:Cupin domain-containing protein n=1 Tax=Winslowiella arboricola TaxID=2978220 RepID=A0A9J6PMT1_9GAMM|nr:cupin domain-containing protein [Winslowiella arboricola]MCU5774504.1 cupin domain-containing protein [Winslowiella arboricola]MCU5778086.1 cupin domain-containing protein [Winslowiella arboricola]